MYKELISKHLKLIPIENLEFIGEKLLSSISTSKANNAKKELYQSLPELLKAENIIIKDSIDILFALYSGSYHKISQDAEERYKNSPTENPIVVRNQIVKEVQTSLQDELAKTKDLGKRVRFDIPKDSSYSGEITSTTIGKEDFTSSSAINKRTRSDSLLRKQEQYKEMLGLSDDEFAQFLSTTPEQIRNKIIDNTIEFSQKPSLNISPLSATKQVAVGVQVGSRDDQKVSGR